MGKFSVGDRVRVMTPGELAESEGAELFKDGYGYWYVNFEHGPGFVSPMGEYCGEVGTIVNVYPRQGYQSVAVEFDNGSLNVGVWCFTNHMFNYIDEKPVELPDVTDLYC